MRNNILIVVSGLPGSGKTTLSEKLARQYSFSLISLDLLKAMLLETGLVKDFNDGRQVWTLALKLAEQQLELGGSVIVDAVNAEEAAKDSWRQLARSQRVELKIIECFNSDEIQHRERVARRKKNLYGIPEVTWEWVENRQSVYTNWKEPILRVDMSMPLSRSLAQIHSYIQSPF